VTAARSEPDGQDGEPGDTSSGASGILLQVAGAAAGIAAFISFVGTIVVRERLQALRLPADSTVALLPQEAIVVAGLRLLLPSIGLGVVILLIVAAAGRGATRPDWLTIGRRTLLGVATAAIVIWVLVRFVGQPVSAADKRICGAVTIAMLGISTWIVIRANALKGIAAALFAVLALYTGGLGVLRAKDPPVPLDYAVLHMKDGGRTSGFLLGRSSDLVVLAPDVDFHTIGRVAAVPREDVVDLRIARRPGTIPDGVTPLVLDAPITGAELPRKTGSSLHDNIVLSRRYLADVRGSSLWKYPPILFPRSIRLWQQRYEEFAVDAVHRWGDGVSASVSELNEEPNLFDNKVVIVSGGHVVAVNAFGADPEGTVVRQVVVVESARGGFRAVCPVATASPDALRPGRPVTLRGLLVAAGTFVDGSGKERHRVALVCSAAK
jgi:hypothetical protein